MVVRRYSSIDLLLTNHPVKIATQTLTRGARDPTSAYLSHTLSYRRVNCALVPELDELSQPDGKSCSDEEEQIQQQHKPLAKIQQGAVLGENNDGIEPE